MTYIEDYQLFIDLAKLLQKHGAKRFVDLANKLNSPVFVDSLSHILLEMSALQSATPQKRRITNSERIEKGLSKIRSTLQEIERNDHQKAILLINFLDGLTNKEILPTSKQIYAFQRNVVVGEQKYSSRGASILILMKSLIEMRYDDLLRLIPKQYNANTGTADTNRSLAGWSDIILRNSKKP